MVTKLLLVLLSYFQKATNKYSRLFIEEPARLDKKQSLKKKYNNQLFIISIILLYILFMLFCYMICKPVSFV